MEAPKVEKVKNVEGEVSVNVRKGRIRQIFDLTISLEIISKNNDGKNDTNPITATIADFMSDTERKDLEVQSSGLPKAEIEDLKECLWSILMQFKKEVEEHGKSLLVASPSQEESSSLAECSPKKFTKILAEDQVTNKHIDPKNSLPSNNYTTSIVINAPIDQVWQALTDSQQIMAWSRGTAQVMGTLTKGSQFNMLNGNIVSTVVECTETPEHCLLLDWRLKEWSANQPSKVEIKLGKTLGEAKTKISFRQSGIPVHELESVKANWDRYYWEPIKTILGCPSHLYS